MDASRKCKRRAGAEKADPDDGDAKSKVIMHAGADEDHYHGTAAILQPYETWHTSVCDEEK